jgi:hypothetical protein
MKSAAERISTRDGGILKKKKKKKKRGMVVSRKSFLKLQQKASISLNQQKPQKNYHKLPSVFLNAFEFWLYGTLTVKYKALWWCWVWTPDWVLVVWALDAGVWTQDWVLVVGASNARVWTPPSPNTAHWFGIRSKQRVYWDEKLFYQNSPFCLGLMGVKKFGKI